MASAVVGVAAASASAIGVSITSDPGYDNTYATGDEVEITLEFDEGVTVEGSPSVILRVGEDRRMALYRSGSETSTLRFVYEVASGDLAESGIALPTNGLRGGELLRDADGNAPETDYPGVRKQPGHMVDAVAPRVAGVEMVSTPRAGNVYGLNDAILVEVTFDEEVHWVKDWDRVWLRIGGKWGSAVAIEQASPRSMVFWRLVGEDDSGGIRVGGTRDLYGAWWGIQDSAGNPPVPAYDASGLAGDATVDGSLDDTTPPGVHSVRVVSIPRSGGIYREGERITVRVVFTEELQVSSDERSYAAATLDLAIGSRAASLTGYIRDGTTHIDFSHVVSAGDVDPDGIAVRNLAMPDVADSVGRGLARGPTVSLAGTRSRVNGRERDDYRPRLVRTEPFGWHGNGRSIRAGRWIGVDLHFDGYVEAIGAPTIAVGDHSRQASASTRLTPLGVTRSTVGFNYRVVADDRDLDGFSIPADAWSEVSFVDRWGAPVPVDLADIAIEDQGILIAGKTSIAGVRLDVPSAGAFATGEPVRVVIEFSDVVTVAGATVVKLGPWSLPCDLDDEGLRLTCERSVVAGESASDLALAAGALQSPDGVTDANGNAVDLDLSEFVGGIAPVSVDGVPPRITAVVLTSRPAAGRPYGAGARIQVVVKFSEAVRATGTPRLALSIGNVERLAPLERAAGAAGLRFQHLVVGSDADADGLSIAANAIRLNGGTITDLAGNPAVLDHPALEDRRRHRVDGSTLDDSAATWVAEAEFFQGPLAARWGWEGHRVERFVDVVAQRAGVLRFRLSHPRDALVEVSVSADEQPVEVDPIGSRNGGRESLFLAHLPPESLPAGTPGTVRIALDPESRLPDTELHVDLQTNPVPMPVFRPVLVPLSILGTEPDVSDPAIWMEHARSLLPIASMELRVRDALDYSPSSSEIASQELDTGRMLESVAALANAEATVDEYHVGLFDRPPLWRSSSSGIGFVPGTVTVNIGPSTAAHEIGHNFGLGHAPCGLDPGRADPNFVPEDGGIGPHAGWSFHEERFISPGDGYFDLMTYCHPQYISEYHYQKAMAWGDHVRERLERNKATERPRPVSAASSPEPLDLAPSEPLSLALSGSVDKHGAWSLFASSPSTRPPRLDAPGEYTISLFDDAGVELYQQSLTTSAISHSSKRLWAVRVPIQSREIHAVRIRGTAGDLLLDEPVELPGHAQPSTPLR